MDSVNIKITTKKVPEYRDYQIPTALYHLHPDYNISEQDKTFIFSKLEKNNIPINKYTVDSAYRLYHRIVAQDPTKDKLKKFAKAIKRYDTGFKKFVKEADPNLLEDTKQQFMDKFGRAPQILEALAKVKEVGEKNNVPEIENIVSKFDVNFVKKLRDNHIPVAYIALFYSVLDQKDCSAILNIIDTPLAGYTNGSEDRISEVCYLGELLLKYVLEDSEVKDKYLNTAKWFVRHLDTDIEVLKFVYKRVNELDLNENDNLDKVKAEIAKNKSLPEVERIEKKYGAYGFKFSDCTCELKQVGEKVYSGKYVTYIMEANDPRQVSLGYETGCCQKLGDAGESAMMHGLINPKAGFLVVEEVSTALIKAQAEIWELNDNTLVLDNIETRSGADIHHYADALVEWVKKSEYENIYTGTGYNDINGNGTFSFEHEEGFIPPVTAEEIYIISHEGDRETLHSIEQATNLIAEAGMTNISDEYVYSDATEDVYIFKQDGKLDRALVSDKEVFEYAKSLSEAGAGKLSSFYRTLYEMNFGKINVPLDIKLTENEIAYIYNDIAKRSEGFTKTIQPTDNEIFNYFKHNLFKAICDYGYDTKGIRYHYGSIHGNSSVTENHYVLNNLPVEKTEKEPVRIEVIEEPKGKKKVVKVKKEFDVLSPALKDSILHVLESDKNIKIESEKPLSTPDNDEEEDLTLEF